MNDLLRFTVNEIYIDKKKNSINKCKTHMIIEFTLSNRFLKDFDRVKRKCSLFKHSNLIISVGFFWTIACHRKFFTNNQIPHNYFHWALPF